jgi:predicted PurR-regulated permease PerM
MEDEQRPVSQLTVAELKRVLVYGIAVLLAITLLGLLVHKVIIALLLGIVAGAYLLPLQEYFEKKFRARSGSALVSIVMIVVPLLATLIYAWREASAQWAMVDANREEIIRAVSSSLARYLPLNQSEAYTALEVASAEALTRSGDAVKALRKQADLIIVSCSLFFFTVYYVLTQRNFLSSYIKVRIPSDYHPFYEKLSRNIGDALHGALQAVIIVQALQAVILFVMNLIFDVPMPVFLSILAFFVGFFPVIGTWIIYVPVSIYLLVFTYSPVAASIYLSMGIVMTIGFSFFLRPKIASKATRSFNFYWMLVALVAGAYTFGIPGLVLGPAILGFIKAVADTMVGEIKYETSLLKEEKDQNARKELQEEAMHS